MGGAVLTIMELTGWGHRGHLTQFLGFLPELPGRTVMGAPTGLCEVVVNKIVLNGFDAIGGEGTKGGAAALEAC